MACFVAPVAEAVVTTTVTKVMEAKGCEDSHKLDFTRKLGWLNKMLWGGSALLAFEHVWHGEVIATFPFLTAVQTGEVSEMLGEIATTGVTMAVLVTLIWGGMVVVANKLEKKATEEETA